jgi:excisionase family DNA binding protein
MGPAAMTVRDVAGYLNVDEKTIYRLAKRGEIPGFKVAGTWRFRLEDIERWIEERKARVAGDDTTKRISLSSDEGDVGSQSRHQQR